MPPEEDLKVTSSDLRRAAQQLSGWGTDVSVAASKAETNLQSRSGGWVGDSKKALEKAIGELCEHKGSVTSRLARESKNINNAADRYAKTEKKNAEKIAKADHGNKPKLNMDH